MKIEIDRCDFEDNEEVPFVYSINFLMCGSFLSLSRQQLDIYSDEEIFGKSIELNAIEAIEADILASYEGLKLQGTGIKFKHPAMHFEESRFEEWNCGFIDGALIVRGESL